MNSINNNKSSYVKVVKFGGSSLASAEQFKKVYGIVTAEESRRYVVPSAPGKRFKEDEKVTDLLIKCQSASANGGDYLSVLEKIKERYYSIIDELGLELYLEGEFELMANKLKYGCSRDYMASRGEYLNGIILASYLGYEFIDAAEVILFDENGIFQENFTGIYNDYYVENGGIIFPNPNAPTAIYEPLETIEDILQHNPGVVVIVDEAYIDFGGKSALSLINKYDNLLVVQTFSKSRSMAGMRIGFAIGNPELISYLNDVKYSFNSYTMSRVAIDCGVEAVKDDDYFKEMTSKIIATREWAKEELQKLGFSFTDSKANFIFATHETVPAKELFQALREADIYVRYFSAPRIDNYLRITIGTEKEMEKLFEFLRKYLDK